MPLPSNASGPLDDVIPVIVVARGPHADPSFSGLVPNEPRVAVTAGKDSTRRPKRCSWSSMPSGP